MFLKLFLFLTLFLTTHHSADFQHVTANFSEENEIRVLKTLDIDSNFIGDLAYENMKTSINKVDILYFAKTLKSGQVIIQTLKEMINKTNVPDTFLYMAMIESKFLTTAKSSKSAAGLWQIMPNTAKHLKLTINSKIDERLDPVKSTEVAIQYLQYLHTRFKKWYLVAFAYNCGETRLAKAIKQSGSDDIFTLLDEDKNYLPKETKQYIRKLIVAALISHSDAMLLETQIIESEGKNIKLKSLCLNKGTSLKKIATSYDIPLKTLKKYNAHILKGVIPKGKKQYCIYIPEDKINQEKSICDTNQDIFSYTIKEGDTLFLISKRFNNKISAIKELNPDLKKTLIVGKKISLIGKIKDKLNLKDIKFKTQAIQQDTTRLTFSENGVHEQNLSEKKVEPKRKTTKIQKKIPAKENKTFTYTVQKGETLFDISKKFNNRVSTLTRLNGTLTEDLDAGLILTIKR